MNRAHSILSGAGRDLLYVLVVLAASIVEFAVWVTGVSLSASLLVLVIGALMWLATAVTFRFAAGVDRRTAGWYRRRPIHAHYRQPGDDLLLSRVRVVTTDPRTWKDLGWLVVNSTVGFLIATVALTLTGLVIAYLTMPLWWWTINDPSQQYATLNLGIYTVTSTGWALVTTGLGLMLLPVAVLLNRAAAAGHARLAARLLGQHRAGFAARHTSAQAVASGAR